MLIRLTAILSVNFCSINKSPQNLRLTGTNVYFFSWLWVGLIFLWSGKFWLGLDDFGWPHSQVGWCRRSKLRWLLSAPSSSRLAWAAFPHGSLMEPEREVSKYQTQAIFIPLFVPYFPLFHWLKQVIWPSPEPLGIGKHGEIKVLVVNLTTLNIP